MIETGDSAPDFTLPMTGDGGHTDIEEFSLSATLKDGPVVLAFYPAAFTGGCTAEMCAFRDAMPAFEDLDAQVYGISVDLPFAQSAWKDAEELNFPMVSDWNHDVIHAYGVVRTDVGGNIETAKRSIFVVDTDGIVRYRWVQEGGLPAFETVVSDVRDAIAEMQE